MLTSNHLLRSTLVLTLGRVAGYGLSFLRNLILARTLAKADFGLAAVFGMAMMMLEVSGRMAFGVQIIQSKEGEDPRFQASAHALQFVGGACSAVLLAALSVPMARIFGVPHTWWAFALLAVVPLSQGLAHLDISRRQRNLDYLPLIISDVGPQLIITLAVWPLTFWLADYRVIVWLLLAKAALSTALSFSFAQRPYQWAWDRVHLRSMLSFGWPLLLTGLIMFGSQQVDQMLVGAVFSLPVLANYALAFSLVSIPWFVLGQVLSSLMLPLMSQAQNDPVRMSRQYRMCAQIAAICGAVVTIPLIVAGEQIITLFYGIKYQGSGVFMALLGAAMTVRFLRFAPAVAAMAKGDTINQLYSNLWRIASLPLALGVWFVGGSSAMIAACAVVGEVLAIGASIVLLRNRQNIPLRESGSASLYIGALLTPGVAVALCGGAKLNLWMACTAGVGSLLLALASAWFIFPEVAAYLLEALRRKSSRLPLQPAGA